MQLTGKSFSHFYTSNEDNLFLSVFALNLFIRSLTLDLCDLDNKKNKPHHEQFPYLLLYIVPNQDIPTKSYRKLIYIKAGQIIL